MSNGDTMKITTIEFPKFTGIRCLMMPYIQGDPDSVPDQYTPYRAIIAALAVERGEVGYLTIDESKAVAGSPHRGARAKHGRALHTEGGLRPGNIHAWGGGGGGHGWGDGKRVTLDRDTAVLLANSEDDTCALWDAEHEDTTWDGDIGHLAHLYPYESATMMKRGEVYRIGILTPHESLPVRRDTLRQFIRIVSNGVHGREEYFTRNPLLPSINPDHRETARASQPSLSRTSSRTTNERSITMRRMRGC